MAKPGDIIVGLDIGTTKVLAVVGEVGAEGVDITGVGEAKCSGLRKGVVVNIESTVASILEAIERAGSMAGVEIATVYAGIAGSHVQGINSNGLVTVGNHEVTADDVLRVLDQTRHIKLPLDRQVIHVLPQDYVVDHQDGVREPVGMSGMRLEARVHLVTAATTAITNLTKCAQRCGLEIAELVLQPLASAEAVLTEDEREIGVALVDIGGGTADVVLYVDGSLVHTSVIGLGGQNLTSDIATVLRMPLSEAERAKVRHGCAMMSMVDHNETIEIPSVGGRAGRSISRHELVRIIEPRMEEIFELVKQTIAQSGYGELLGAGVVLCGGATLLDGCEALAEEILDLPVRRGGPMGVGGMSEMVKSPAHATAVGLLKYGVNRPSAVPQTLTSAQVAHAAAAAAAMGQSRGATVARDEEEGSTSDRGVGGKLWSWFREVF
ncbi:MAG: cell division protein FtsA [Deltaproteobacteria bacterium]|nr:cell division protein FtsA [Deltaproteobacteria bacterium]